MAALILTGNDVLGVLYLETEGRAGPFSPRIREILLGLEARIASTLVSSRAMRLELDRALAHRRLHEQRELLAAAERIRWRGGSAIRRLSYRKSMSAGASGRGNGWHAPGSSQHAGGAEKPRSRSLSAATRRRSSC